MSKASKKNEKPEKSDTVEKTETLKEYFKTAIKPILEEHEKTLNEHTDYFAATEQMLVSLKELVSAKDEQLQELQSTVAELEASVGRLSEKRKKRAAPEDSPQVEPKVAKTPAEAAPAEDNGKECRLCSGQLNGNPKKHFSTTKHLSKLSTKPVYCSLECTRKCRQDWVDALPEESPVFSDTLHMRTNVGVVCTVCGGLVQLNQ